MLSDLLTIVIPCKNEENYIGYLLSSLASQVHIKHVRIIIADAYSTDNTYNVIKRYKTNLNIEVIDGGSVSVGRNNGAMLVTTPYILFIDADVRFFNNTAIYDAVTCIHNEQLDLITMHIKNYGYDLRASLLFSLFNLFNLIFTKFTPFAVGAFFLTRKTTFDAYGGFPTKYHTSEDYILSRQYKVSKFKIIKHYFGQDERRFKKLGYLGMIWYLFVNFLHRNDLTHFEKTNIKYWE